MKTKVKNTMSAGILAAAQDIRKRVRSAVRIVMEVKRTEVVRRTPIEDGILRSTVHVEGPEQDGNIIRCAIVAGGPAAPYAIVQHEDLTFKHTEGQAKYIESVLFESRPTIGREIGALVKR